MSTKILTQTRAQTKTPPRYKVLLLNDDYTPMDFVVLVLLRYFQKTEEEANRVMFTAHQKGVCVAGVYTFEIAETKVVQVEEAAAGEGYPLKCALEPE